MDRTKSAPPARHPGDLRWPRCRLDLLDARHAQTSVPGEPSGEQQGCRSTTRRGGAAMNRRARRSGFGTVIATGTATHPAFAIRWWEGSRRKQKSGFRTRTDAAEALARVRTGLGDGTLVEKRRAAIGFGEVARQWLDLHSRPNLRSHEDNEERFEKHAKVFFGDGPLTTVTATRILEFRARLQASKLAPRTINLVLALVRSILRFGGCPVLRRADSATETGPAARADRLGAIGQRDPEDLR